MDGLFIVIVIKNGAAIQTEGHDRSKCIVLWKLIHVIAFITACDWIKSNTDVFSFFPRAAPNWFGAEIAHKSLVYQTSFEQSSPQREFVTHPLVRELLLRSRT